VLSFTKAGTASNIGILKVSVLPGAFAASYPNYTREALCTESFQKSSSNAIVSWTVRVR